MEYGHYKIILPEGEASRPFYQLSIEERVEVGKEIFQKVTELAKLVGMEAVTSSTIRQKSEKASRDISLNI